MKFIKSVLFILFIVLAFVVAFGSTEMPNADPMAELVSVAGLAAIQYKVFTPSNTFSGVRNGISFAKGFGITTSESVAQELVRVYGYRCDNLDESETVEPIAPPKSPAEILDGFTKKVLLDQTKNVLGVDIVDRTLKPDVILEVLSILENTDNLAFEEYVAYCENPNSVPQAPADPDAEQKKLLDAFTPEMLLQISNDLMGKEYMVNAEKTSLINWIVNDIKGVDGVTFDGFVEACRV